MKFNFLYIDDEKHETAEGMIKNLLGDIEEDVFEYEIEQPKNWNKQKLDLIENQQLNKYDGLVLDLKLEFSNDENNEVKFSGPDLAQTIRSDVRAGKIKDLPIFLFSTNDNFKDLLDRTSIDLFDKMYSKNKDADEKKTRNEFISFAKAYKTINENKSVENLMRKEIKDNEELVSLKAELSKFKTAHEYIYLINQYVIQSNGLLLDEELLAVRLGIDIQNSEDWEKLKNEIIVNYKYAGILSDCYERWWQTDILNWWKETVGKSLLIMSAHDKVNAISEKFGLQNIVALTLPEHHRFETYWYKCRLSNTPLDTSDALITIEMPRYVWQEPSYISVSYIKSDDRDSELVKSLLGSNELEMFEDL